MAKKATLITLDSHLKELNKALNNSQQLFQNLSSIYQKNVQILENIREYKE